MKILDIRRDDKGRLLVTGLLGTEEYRQLGGALEHLMVFPPNVVEEAATFTKAGANHSMVKYVLLPIKFRHRITLDSHDFSSLRCGTLENAERTFLIYAIPKKGPVKPKRQAVPSEEA